MHYLVKIILLLAALLALPTLSWAAIYKCPAKNGSVTYSNAPCESGARKDGDSWVNLNDERAQKAQRDELRKEALEKERVQNEKAPTPYASESNGTTNPVTPVTNPSVPSRFKCDGRIHCSQMTSCEEAKYFLMNCPNTKMDGNNDGTPCEQQWCETGLDSNSSGRGRH